MVQDLGLHLLRARTAQTNIVVLLIVIEVAEPSRESLVSDLSVGYVAQQCFTVFVDLGLLGDGSDHDGKLRRWQAIVIFVGHALEQKAVTRGQRHVN